MRHIWPITLLILATCGGASLKTGPAGEVVIQNNLVRYAIAADGKVAQFVDLGTGRDYAAGGPCARVKAGGKDHPATAAAVEGPEVVLQFGDSGVKAALRPVAHPQHIALEVARIEGNGVEEFTFLDIDLKLEGKPEETFAACALALNLKTNVSGLPRPAGRLRASCHEKFGFVGAAAAIVATPPDRQRDALKEAVTAATDLPKSPLGGPWALDGERNRGSYLFDFGDLNENNVDQWIKLVQDLGFKQIDFHGGRSFRFGDCWVNPASHPRGRDGFKAAIDKLHDAGIMAGLHSYAFFINKQSRYVTPVPHPNLAADAVFTLSKGISDGADAVAVDESTKHMSPITGFFVRNSATLHIDNELITYAEVSKEPPYAFTKCTRGAFGTRRAAHKKGAKVRHLKETYGLFVPDPDTPLFGEIAQNYADFYNYCGFDMMYLDAYDGSDVLGGGQFFWHYGSRFIFELWKRLKKPPVMEASAFNHHLWFVRSRAGAWDHPRRSHKHFIDTHAGANQGNLRAHMPSNLGWWAVKQYGGANVERTFPDDIEYLCAKALGGDYSLSLMGLHPGNAGEMWRLKPIFKRYETLRISNAVPEAVREELSRPGSEFRLVDGKFHPVRSHKHKCERNRNSWKIANPFGAQPLRLRIETLMSVQPYDTKDSNPLLDAASAQAFGERAAAKGVIVDLAADGEKIVLTAKNETDKRKGSWAKFERTFSPPLDLSKAEGMGVWIEGDGQGEVLNFQLRSPEHLVGGIGEHYAVIDFTGRRYVELVEAEGRRYADYSWPYGHLYSIYRENVQYRQVEKFSVWINDLPPGRTVTCTLGPVRALPLAPGVVKNPSVTVGGRTITFPVELKAGCYLEMNSASDCRVYGPKDELLSEVKPQGEAPQLEAGENDVTFRCETAEPHPRAYVTIFAEGPPISASTR